ncbi:MAG: ShlB/FhaC/HecB family hemolysin secretion/activation protein, partial [Alphaproteobacteria bacterium]|nr:ShlB/FhaC/HecB family hemolysin secretion/activation protein [Alphaproteobacteria bacterium]
NQPGAPKDELKPQYEALKLFASFSKRLVAPLSFVSEFDSQYSKQNLFGSEQFSIGGYYSVRGFLENNISTSSGYHLRNKLSFGLGAVSPYLNSITIEPFYDYGHAQDQYRHYSGRLSGAGLKGIFSHKYFNASVTYAEVLSKSQLLNTSRYRENQMLYFELSAGCC